MGLRRSLRSWKQDRKRVSMEKGEVDYIKRLARKFLVETNGEPEHVKRLIRVSSLRRLCKYVLKTKPITRKTDKRKKPVGLGE